MTSTPLCPRCTLWHTQIDLDYPCDPTARACLQSVITVFCRLNHRKAHR